MEESWLTNSMAVSWAVAGGCVSIAGAALVAEGLCGSRNMKTLTTNKLFTPIQVGSMGLKHRVVMGPLTRSRSVQPGNIPGDLMLEYYSQRASDGGLIVSEATSISVAGGGWFAAPGLYSEEQVSGWKRITDAVH